MRGNDLLDKIELVDPEFVEEADKIMINRKRKWPKICALAACAAVVVLGGAYALTRKGEKIPGKESEQTVMVGGISRDYKDVSVASRETAVIWPWKYLSLYEQYGSLTIDGETYGTTEQKITKEQLGEKVGDCELYGTDIYTETDYTMQSEAYQIKGVEKSKLLAVKLENDYYVYRKEAYEMPSCLGDILDEYSLLDYLSLDSFKFYENNTAKEEKYCLTEDEAIKKVLNDCRESEFIADEDWDYGKMRNYIAFSVTSAPLGISRKALQVTEDGYLWTNMFDYGYVFAIGEEKANEIISYAKANGVEEKKETELQSLTGTIVEIGEDYILVDDSVLCKNEDQGMVFRVPMNDLRIRRFIEFTNAKTGDLVLVDFCGIIDTAHENLVSGAYQISSVTISDGMVQVEE